MVEPNPPSELSSRLEQGEELIWWGRPVPRGYVAGGAIVTVPAGLVALISAYLWVGGSDVSDLPLWSLPLVALLALFAAHMILLRPLLSLRQARATSYAITDRRALAVCLSSTGRVFSVPHDQGKLQVVRGPHGAGKVQFSRTAASSIDVLIMGRAAVPGFYGLKDVEDVARVLRKARGEA